THWARTEATDIRILLSILLLAPPAFCMGMMFPLGLSLWRGHPELLPFFWSANGITSMFASALGMALSIEYGIAKTYALGACLYVVCALIIMASRQTRLLVATPAGGKASVRQDEVVVTLAASDAPLQPQIATPSNSRERNRATNAAV